MPIADERTQRWQALLLCLTLLGVGVLAASNVPDVFVPSLAYAAAPVADDDAAFNADVADAAPITDPTKAPDITIVADPPNPVAGTRVKLVARRTNLPPKATLFWHFPEDAKYQVDDTVLTFKSPEVLKYDPKYAHVIWLTWPVGGVPLEISCTAHWTSVEEDTDASGKLVLVQTDAIDVVGKLTLTQRGGTPIGPDPSVPIDPPSAAMQATMAEIRALAQTHADKTQVAAQAAMWADLSAALGALDSLGQYPPTVAKFQGALTAFVTAAGPYRKLTNAMPGLTAKINTAFTATFGDEDKTLDKAASRDFVQGLAWAFGGK